MSFPRYPALKDSAIPWLDRVPAHWAIQPMLAVAFERCETNKKMAEGNLLSLSYGHIVEKDIESNDGLLPESFETYQIVQPGDTVFRLTDLQNDQRSLRTGLVRSRGIITSAYVAVCPKRLNPRYFSYLMRAYDVAKAFYSMGGGLRQSMKFSDLKRLPVLVPPLSEQLAVSTFIDRETAKIDALVAEQERLIELLQEKRQAVISHVVAKGLHPDVPTKPTGVEWLGDVPAHWDVLSLRNIADVVRGASPRPAGDPKYFDGDFVPWVTVAEITKDSEIVLRETATRLTQEGAGQSRPIKGGTVVYSNSGATLGVPKILAMDACANDGVLAFENLSDGVNPVFLYYYLSSITGAMREKVRQGSGQPNLNTEIAKSIPLAVPVRREQEDIVRFIQSVDQWSNALVCEARASVDLLQERRSALIAAAVIGQIDVRGLVEQEAA